MADMTWQPWWDVAAQKLGPQAWPVIQQLQSISNTNDWTSAINQTVDSLNKSYGNDWQDPSRGSSPQIGAQIVSLYRQANPAQAAALEPAEASFDQQGAARAAQIQKEQNLPKKGGLFGGGLGTALGIGGLALGGLGLAGIGPFAGLGGAGAAGAADAAGAAGAFDAAGLGTGIDAGIMSSTAGLGTTAGTLGTIANDVPWGVNPISDSSASSFVGDIPTTTDVGGTSIFGATPSASDLASQAALVTGQGAADTGGTLTDWLHGLSSAASTGLQTLANNPFSAGSAVAQYLLGQKNANALKGIQQQITQNSNPLAQPQRQAFQDLAYQTASNPLGSPFTSAYLNAGQNLINANVAKTGNPVNVFASKIPQIVSGASDSYNQYLNTLMGFGGYNQANTVGQNLASTAGLQAGINTSQAQAYQQLLGSLSGSTMAKQAGSTGTSNSGLTFS